MGGIASEQPVNHKGYITVWNRTRTRPMMQNQRARELISARKTSHKHDEGQSNLR